MMKVVGKTTVLEDRSFGRGLICRGLFSSGLVGGQFLGPVPSVVFAVDRRMEKGTEWRKKNI